MEKIPNNKNQKESTITKFIGSNLEQNEKMRELFKDKFESDYFDPATREKTEEEKKFLDELSEKMAEFIKRYGGIPIKIPPRLVRFLDWSKISPDMAQVFASLGYGVNKAGYFELDQQTIAIFSDTSSEYPNRIGLANSVAHEFIHANSFQSVVVYPGNERSAYRNQRVGLSAGKGRFFDELNEAITAELNKRFHREFLKDIDFTASSFKKLQEDIENIKAKVEDASKWVDDLASIHEIPLPDGTTNAIFEDFEYKEHREKLNKIIDKINELNPDRFKDREEIFNIFAKAMITGEIKELTELIETTSGRGSFKKLASSLDLENI